MWVLAYFHISCCDQNQLSMLFTTRAMIRLHEYLLCLSVQLFWLQKFSPYIFERASHRKEYINIAWSFILRICHLIPVFRGKLDALLFMKNTGTEIGRDEFELRLTGIFFSILDVLGTRLVCYLCVKICTIFLVGHWKWIPICIIARIEATIGDSVVIEYWCEVFSLPSPS